MKYYVFSGSLRGVEVEARFPEEAVDKAVRENLPCVLGPAIRVSFKSRGSDYSDSYFGPPYEEIFPDLFDGTLDVTVVPVEKK